MGVGDSITLEHKRDAVLRAKALVAAGGSVEAWRLLRSVAHPRDEFALQHRYARLIERIDATELALAPIRLAIVATSTVDHLVPALRFWLAMSGFSVDLYIAEFGTLEQTILDPDSELYRFRPDVVWLFTTGRDVELGREVGGVDAAGSAAAVAASVDHRRALWKVIASRMPAQIVQNNADLDPVRVMGNFESVAPWTRTNLLRAYNLELARAVTPGVTLFDLDWLAGDFGRQAWHDGRWWYHSKHAFSLEAIGMVCHAAAQLIAGIRGRAKKCVVVDLDNTVWGGVIGDDGLEGIALGEGDGNGEAYLAFQRYLKSLSQRGIVLAVASKNEEAAARLPFERHPEMVLRLEDIAVFLANWVDKATNIREIAATLNIGLDSIVFVDDNPVERALVREALPMVEVPELGDDPACYREILDRALFFETVTFSDDDRQRADSYRQNAQRKVAEASFADLDGFLRSLEMRGTVGELDEANLPRFVQLLNKSNQFHLTTTRHNEARMREFMADPHHLCLYFRLEDRFGDNGLISTVILALPRDAGEPVRIDTWAMSCRVLSRRVEQFILAEICRRAAPTGSRIVGRYVPTAKNALVADLYRRLGFTKLREDDGATEWELPADTSSVDLNHHIERIEGRSSDRA